jgi:hypothetical protein
MEVIDPRTLCYADAYVPPNTSGEAFWAPIPSEIASGLAQILASVDAERVGSIPNQRPYRLHAFNLGINGMQNDLDGI